MIHIIINIAEVLAVKAERETDTAAILLSEMELPAPPQIRSGQKTTEGDPWRDAATTMLHDDELQEVSFWTPENLSKRRLKSCVKVLFSWPNRREKPNPISIK